MTASIRPEAKQLNALIFTRSTVFGIAARRWRGRDREDWEKDPQPVPPDKGSKPPITIPPDQPGLPEGNPDPDPVGDPETDQPTRLVIAGGPDIVASASLTRFVISV